MQVFFRIQRQHSSDHLVYDGQPLNILISELDFVDIEIRTEEFYESTEIHLVIGNTYIKLADAVRYKDQFCYKINIEYLIALLPGDSEAHLNREWIKTDIGERRIGRLFLNEIGLSKVFIRKGAEELHVANVRVSTTKLSTENYEMITFYLISVGYFDSNIIYKSVIEGSQDDIRNTLLESLRELRKRLQEWFNLTPIFKYDPLTKYSERRLIVPYRSTISMDDDSIDWLSDNVSEIKNVSRIDPDLDFLINAKPVKVELILSNQLYQGFDSYENRIIHGFLLTLRRLLTSLSDQIGLLSPRTRIDNFRDFLVNCFNNLIKETLKEATDSFQQIYRFYNLELPVSTPIFGFPAKVEGFRKKFHYERVLDFIDYSRRLFNVNIDLNSFNLEVESFDKLFEIYCFYLIKDTLSNMLGSVEWRLSPRPSDNNKLAGKYEILNSSKCVNIFYEDFPSDFRQFSRTRNGYNPDFIISLSKGSETFFLILDAKYKSYNTQRLQEDLSRLTLNYLHKIGPAGEKQKVIGLFTVSLSRSNSNKASTIFKNEHSLFAPIIQRIYPQIGNIEIYPKNLTFQANPLVAPLAMLLDFAG